MPTIEPIRTTNAATLLGTLRFTSILTGSSIELDNINDNNRRNPIWESSEESFITANIDTKVTLEKNNVGIR
jgi:hypothetical protein